MTDFAPIRHGDQILDADGNQLHLTTNQPLFGGQHWIVLSSSTIYDQLTIYHRRPPWPKRLLAYLRLLRKQPSSRHKLEG